MSARAGRGGSSELACKPEVAASQPYEMFAAMIDRHLDGIAAICRPENKVSLGFVEGLNTGSA